MVRLDGGEFRMGTDGPWAYDGDGEGPIHPVELAPFWIDATTVTNDAFVAFAAATGHVTDAERYAWSFVFAGLLPDDFEDTRAVAQSPWWRQVYGADWRRPEGPRSSIDDRLDHPVVHVSWRDARAFCAWAGLRLPTEAEWEFGARGGLVQKRFPWGDELEPAQRHHMNVWQGTFPSHNTRADGYLGTCPVNEFEPNGYGLCNTSGNVWEWCDDMFDPALEGCDAQVSPATAGGEAKVIRGGSYLCHASYCNRYRVAARSSNTIASSTGNMGFRCARDA
jgi:formylglycine-generating enzyme required for sulfatase activity